MAFDDGGSDSPRDPPVMRADSGYCQGASAGCSRTNAEVSLDSSAENRVSESRVDDQSETEIEDTSSLTPREQSFVHRRRISAFRNGQPVVTDLFGSFSSPPKTPDRTREFKLQSPPNPKVHRAQRHRRNLPVLDGSQSLKFLEELRNSVADIPNTSTDLPLRRLSDSDGSVEQILDDYTPEMAGNHSFPSLDSPIAANNRSAASPTGSVQGGQSNGSGGMANPANYMAPLPVGHQQDLNYLYAQIQELSALLKSNREKVNVVTKAAEEVAKRANTNGFHAEGEDTGEDDKARIHDLERQLARANYTIELYKHEQTENTNLIAMYEDALGNATEGIRNYCLGIEERFLNQRRHYNNLLQQEKDEHLQSRLDRDHWNAQTLRVCEMIRIAHRLRVDEWCEEYKIIAGLQTEVRCFRRLIGLDPEKPEEETGWPYLKDAPLDDTGKNS